MIGRMLLALVLGAAPLLSAAEPAERFRAEMAAKAEAADAADRAVVAGRDGWLFLRAELRHVGAGVFWGERAAEVGRSSRPQWADPLPAIVDFHEQLAAMGIELILLPVPPKALIYPEKISDAVAADAPRLDTVHQQFYALLRERGVKVIDLTDDLLKLKRAGGVAVYCRQDTHWATPAIEAAARRIGAEVADRPWRKEVEPVAFAVEQRTVEINGDLRQLAGDDTLDREQVPLKFVGTADGAGAVKPVVADADAPVLLLGDSHLLVFHAGADMHAAGAGLVEHASRLLGRPVDVIAVRGSGATPCRINLVRKAYADPSYLANKKLVVWVLTAREFTEATAWRPLPLTRPKTK